MLIFLLIVIIVILDLALLEGLLLTIAWGLFCVVATLTFAVTVVTVAFKVLT